MVLAEPETAERGRLLDAFHRLLAPLSRRLDYLALYPSRVVAQSADGTLDLFPDDPRVPPCRGVPVRYGLPGVRAAVPAGTRVLLTYEGGDPRRPVASLWEPGDVTRWTLDGGTHRAAREGHATADGAVSALITPPAGTPPLVNLILTYTSPGGAPQTLTISGLPPTVTVTGGWTIAGEIAEGSGVLRLP